jgi:hypothetical protein
MTPREILAHMLNTGLYGFGGRVRASARMKIADGMLAALDAAGYVIVPKEPTQEMIEAGWAAAHDESAAECWRDMLAASQQKGG